jgi:hypothetical protein
MVFSTVASRFDELKHVALDEANAIGTAYLRADLLPEADRAATRKLLNDYVNLRIEVMDDGTGQQLEQAIDRSEWTSRRVFASRSSRNPEGEPLHVAADPPAGSSGRSASRRRRR